MANAAIGGDERRREARRRTRGLSLRDEPGARPAERDANNVPCAQDAPPVLPAQLVKLSPRMFVKDILAPHREQLAKKWTEEWIDDVKSDHRLLRIPYGEDEELRAVIDKHDVNTFFDEA